MAKQTIEKARKHLRALLLEIERHNRLYYRENKPEISDFEYDCLQAEKKALYANFPELEKEEGPGSDLGEHNFEEIAHWSPMLSLANTYSKEELSDFIHKLQEKVNVPSSYILEPKVDGMAINLLYQNGKFFKALTRGDGKVGEDVTQNILTIANIPQLLNGDVSEQIEIRGEVYISEENFLKINQEQEALGLEPFANARNLASGSVKLLNLDEVKARRLSFVAHGVGPYEALESQYACRLWLKDQGFPVFPAIELADSLENIWQFVENFHTIAEKLPYRTDGVVIKLNDRSLQQTLGTTAKSPRWAIAYKFEPESAETLLKSVTFQVGRTGVITPVAELEPVNLAGSRISRATLHNFDEISKKDIRIGDYVILQKAGEVIPAIVSVNKDKRNADVIPIQRPKLCPVCGTPLVQLEDEVAIRCPSIECPEQFRLKITHFASKDAMDIFGMGPKVVNMLVQKGWIKHMADIFHLWQFRNEWVAMDGYGILLVDQLLQSIENAKTRPLWRFIYALSINNLGVEIAKNLAVHFKSLDAIKSASVEDLQVVPLVGPCAAQSIHQFFTTPNNLKVLETFNKVGFVLSVETENTGPWKDKNFVLTGTLQHMGRSEAKKRIEACGGKVSENVSSKTFAVIVGDNPGDKLKKATHLSISIWDENEFLTQLNDAH